MWPSLFIFCFCLLVGCVKSVAQQAQNEYVFCETDQECKQLLQEYKLEHIWDDLIDHRWSPDMWLDMTEEMLKNMNFRDSDIFRFKTLQQNLKHQHRSINDFIHYIFIICNNNAKLISVLFTSIIIPLITYLYNYNKTKINQCSNSNKQDQIIEMYKKISIPQHISTEFSYNESTNSTYVVDLNRDALYPKEIELGYLGPIKNIQHAISQCKDGDRLLIHGGTYGDNLGGDVEVFINKSIQLIGVGPNVIITNNGDEYSLGIYCEGNNNVYFENITFDSNVEHNGAETIICSKLNCKVWMNNVKVKFSQFVIVVTDKGSLDVRNCDFIGVGPASSNAIDLETSANIVNIEGCTFKNAGYNDKETALKGACIYISRNKIDRIKLICVGNIFENNLSVPIVKQIKDDNGKMINKNRYELKNNVLRGFNATRMEPSKRYLVNANQLYYDFS